MAVVLAGITFVCYLLGAMVLLITRSDIQMILAGVLFTCGTVTLVGLTLLYRLSDLIKLIQGKKI